MFKLIFCTCLSLNTNIVYLILSRYLGNDRIVLATSVSINNQKENSIGNTVNIPSLLVSLFAIH